MIPHLYYFEAKQRLDGAIECIKEMGGEDECQPMLLGQRDMLILEKEYYRIRMVIMNYSLLFLSAICVIMYVLYRYGVLNV